MSISKADIDALSKGFAPVIRAFVAQELNRAPFNNQQMDILGEVVAMLKRDIRDETNSIRAHLDMPIIKGMPLSPLDKPRYRVPAPTRPWVP